MTTRVVGLTGGIGTGKSTVARMFEQLGAVILDADAIVHELQAKGQPMLDVIAEAFGKELIRADGSLDREALGQLVFGDDDARAKLNQIVHPAVGAEMARRLAEARDSGKDLVLLDIPLLLETRSRGGSGALVDAVVVVYAPAETQIARQLARDGRSREDALERMAAQLPIEEKRQMADHVIDNSGSLEDTESQVRALYATLTTA